MKTILLSASFAVISLVAAASGTTEKNVATYYANESLISEFGKVKDVRWTNAKDGMMRADFTIDDRTISAFFDEKGEYIASTHTITTDDLPSGLRSTLKKELKDAVITSVFEMNTKDETAYFIETIAGGKKRVWKGNEGGQLSRYYVKS